MRPNEDQVFGVSAMDLLMRVVPEISPAYHQGTVGMIAAMLAMAAEEWDRVASRRIEENAAIRAIIRRAAPEVPDSGLRARLESMVHASDSDFRISALERSNCDLRAALIELHAAVERQVGPRAREIEDEIWRELSKSTERRRFSTAPF
jgi:hypothetical protein